ncbi:Methylenetetrahydrofolate--tRNA-(uracil-5-)-methyltransferase TrmFO [compost metagenome]
MNKDLSSKNDPWLFFAGQITGVEGYFESTCVGLLVAEFINQKLQDKPFTPPPRASAMGSLMEAITDPTRAEHFQPTNINFALLPPLAEKERDKELRKKKQIQLAREAFQSWNLT